jgi:hypothetical protein
MLDDDTGAESDAFDILAAEEPAMPQKPRPEAAPAPKQGSNGPAAGSGELSAAELDRVTGGKLPGKKKPPTLTLK